MTIASSITSIDCDVFRLSLRGYRETASLQETLRENVISGGGKDAVLFVQHFPVISLGASGDIRDILVSGSFLKEQNIDIVRTDRGGKVTYHGPGQLVIYPIFNLRQRDKDIHLFVRNLEEVIIRTLYDFSISASRNQGYPGVWVGEDKVCSVGIGVKRWVTKHGLALNVNNDLTPFSYINPCGTKGNMISMKKLLSMELSMDIVVEIMLHHFSGLFNLDFKFISN